MQRPRPATRATALALWMVVLTPLLTATSYAPVSFDELVDRADVIFVGEVMDVRPFPTESREGTVIRTRVVFQVTDPLWGTSSSLEIFEFLGGDWQGTRLSVAEMPTFTVGDRRVIFARRRRSINPIVGFTQGVLRVSRDATGVDTVRTLADEPVASPDAIGKPRREPSARPMRLADFRTRIKARVAQVHAR